MGKALRRRAALGGIRERARRSLLIGAAALATAIPGSAPALPQEHAQRFDGGRFTFLAFPRDAALARSLLAAAVQHDTFPWLPRPRERVVVMIAPDRRHFRQWIGPGAPEWGAAIAFPESNRIVMQGSSAGSDAGDPQKVLRHEMAHLALHEALGELPPRWFDEGYAGVAAGEWGRDESLAANVALAVRGMPSLDSLESGFEGGAGRAEATYALSYRAVAELAALDPVRGLSLFFQYWKEAGRMDLAIREAFGITQAEFEKRWQQRTRRRYGGLALFADLSLASLLMLVIVGPLYLLRRRRDRDRMAALVRAEERADQLARESAIEELLRSLPRSEEG